MGTWGDKLYEDDDAQEARDGYRAILAEGFDGKDATDRFLKRFKPSHKDSDDAVIWFALADTQWQLGRLDDRVKAQAIEFIDNEESLDRWEEASPQQLASRRKVLSALKKRLLSRQPAQKKIKVNKPTKIASWKPGELFSYRLRSGKFIVMCLQSVDPAHHAELFALDWIGKELPSEAELKKLPRKAIDYEGKDKQPLTYLSVAAYKKRDVPYDRMQRLNIKIKKAPHEEFYRSLKSWEGMDNWLKDLYGWK